MSIYNNSKYVQFVQYPYTLLYFYIFLFTERKFAMEHIENLSQTRPYTPYSTVKPKIEAWTPPAKPALEQPKLD